MELQYSQYQHQSTPVPSTDKVCFALMYRNIDALGRRHQYTGGFLHEVSTTELDVCWWVHVSNAEVLQRSGLSTSTLRHRRLSLFGHVARLGLRVPAYDALRLMADTYEGRKALENTAGSPSQRLVQQDSGGCQRSTAAIFAVEIWDCQGSRSGATVTRTICDDDDGDDDDDDDEGCKTCVKNWR